MLRHKLAGVVVKMIVGLVEAIRAASIPDAMLVVD